MDRNEMFWKLADLSTRNPQLYKAWCEWARLLRDTPFYELEPGLKDYFGCSQQQSDSWTDWKRAVDMKDDQLVIDAKLEVAQKITWDGRSPQLFEFLMKDGWLDQSWEE